MDFEDALDGEGGEAGEEGGFGQDMFMFGMDEKEAQEMKQNKDSVVFLIDCHKSMHDKNPHNGEDQPSNLEQIIKACLSFMKTKIITSDNDKIGIVLYGCKETNNSLNFNHVYVVQKLDSPDAAAIKGIERRIPTFSKDFGYAREGLQVPLFEAFWICHQEFKSVEKQSYNKRIFLFTNEDNPGSAGDKTMAEQRANDLSSLGVDIELFPMPKPSQQRPTFDVKLFFANIISFDEEEQFSELLGIQGAQNRITELMKRIRQKEFRKRTQGKCLFSLTPKSQIALGFYTTVMPTKKPTAQKVNAANNKSLKSTQRFICEETGTVLYKNQIGTFYPVGGEKIKITPDDVKQIKYFDAVGMKLMGFKPRSYLKVHHNIKHSYFIYPDEKRVTGSSQVIDALVKEMIRDDKIAIVRFIPRDNSVVRFCALLPQEEKVDEEDGFQTPPGFQCIFLPFADDIRDLNQIMEAAGYEAEGQNDEEEKGEKSIFDQLSKDEKNAAKLLVKNMTIDFNSRNFENPSIQQFYAGLQALALNEEEPEPVEDLLEPDYEGMKRFDPLIQKFKDAFYDGQDEDPACASVTGAGRGRGRGGTTRGGSARGGRGGGSSQTGTTPAPAGRGRGAAKASESQPSSQMKSPAPKRGAAAKMKDIIEDLDDYDEDMNEKELPMSQAQQSNASKSAANNKKRKEPVEPPKAPPKASRAAAKRRKGGDSSEEEADSSDSEQDLVLDSSDDDKKKGKKKAPAGKGAKASQASQSQSQAKSPAKSSAKGKKKKAQESEEEEDPKLDALDQKFITMLREGTLEKATLPALKEYLTAKNLPNKGNKTFLLELVTEYLEQLGFA